MSGKRPREVQTKKNVLVETDVIDIIFRPFTVSQKPLNYQRKVKILTEVSVALNYIKTF